MLLADLKAMAGGMGISGAGAMKKAQLVEAIKSAQAGSAGGGAPAGRARPTRSGTKSGTTAGTTAGSEQAPGKPVASSDEPGTVAEADARTQEPTDTSTKQQPSKKLPKRSEPDGSQPSTKSGGAGDQGDQAGRPDKQAAKQKQPDGGPKDAGQATGGQKDAGQAPGGQRDGGQGQGGQDNQNDEEGRSGRNRRRRGRDRTRPGAAPSQQGGQRNEPDTTILEDDVLVPAGGILDVLDNYAFVRTTGYLPGVDDVYLSLSMVRKFGLRRGDAIVGQVRQPREGERKEKFNPMVRIDTVNGSDPQHTATRPEFAKLTPVHPTTRLRMETDTTNHIGRTIDLLSPIGKGQRGLVVGPEGTGKTTVLRSVASSITANNPECHLMVVLVDERPEEVTEFERAVKGEVIASTFDRQPADHTMVAELAIERAKRLVELGHDVVVLLDNLVRLGRAYHLSGSTSGRTLAAGVDAGAVQAPKQFFGAARNVENGGSLTILATAVSDSGSAIDEVFLEEFSGSDNMVLRLRRDFADSGRFPAVDAVRSGTRREELMISEEEVAIMWKLRRFLASVEDGQAVGYLLDRLSGTHTNIELLTQVQKSTPTLSGGQ
jgi:transcription termination factor Rho